MLIAIDASDREPDTCYEPGRYRRDEPHRQDTLKSAPRDCQAEQRREMEVAESKSSARQEHEAPSDRE